MPTMFAGETAVIWVLLFTVNEVAGVSQKFTALASVNPVPVIVTDVPPMMSPLDGSNDVSVGGLAVPHGDGGGGGETDGDGDGDGDDTEGVGDGVAPT